MIFKKYYLISISFLIGLTLWACSDFYDGYFNYSNISPEITVNNVYNPLFFDNDNFYYQGQNINPISSFDEVNVREWQQYLHKEIDSTVISDLLLTKEYDNLVELEKYAKNQPNHLSETYKKNYNSPKFKTNLFSNFIEYINLSNQSAPYSLQNIDNWTLPEKPTANLKLLENYEKKYEATSHSDPFLHRKYALQIVRYHYFFSPLIGPLLLNKFEPILTNDATSARILAYIAGTFKKSKNYAKANYLYSRAYSLSDNIKLSSSYSFHPQEESDWNKTLALAKNKSETIVLWHLLGYYFDPMRSIEEIAKIDPTSPYMDLLLVRALNILEMKLYSSNESQSYEDNNRNNKGINQMIQKIKGITENPQNSNPFLWNIATGYGHWMMNNEMDASHYYTIAEKYTEHNKAKEKQLLLLQTLNKIKFAKKISPELESIWANDMITIKKIDTSLPELRFDYSITYFRNRLSNLYAKEHDIYKIQCLNPSDSFYRDDNNIDKLINYLHHPTKPIDRLIQSYYPLTVEDIDKFKGLKKIYNEDYEGALTIFKKYEKSDTNFLPANPFNGFIKDCHDCEFLLPQKTPYSSLKLVQRMHDFHDSIVQNKNVYSHSLLLANAYYNISYYGNARSFYNFGVLGDDAYSPEYLGFTFKPMILSMTNASKYYKLALDNASTLEQKAKCTYMLAKCERNEYYNQKGQYFVIDSNRNIEELAHVNWVFAGNYFKKLKESYLNTAFAQEVIKECSYFNKYINKK